MPRYIAFLRAINVGGRTVRMERLRQLFEALGLTRVETFIASGNVIFETPASDMPSLERGVESHLRNSLGYEVATFIRSDRELQAIARYQPFPELGANPDGNSLYVAFLPGALADAARERLMAFRSAANDFHAHERQVYWLCRTRFSDSAFSGALLEKAVGVPATVRNVTTLRKLAAKYPPAE
jgi:uncharacterized protein (DUF1697 family)